MKSVGLKINPINRVSIFVLKITLHLNFAEKGTTIKFGILSKIDLPDSTRPNPEIIVKMMNALVKIHTASPGPSSYGLVSPTEGKID